VISGSWTSQATGELQSFAGSIDADGNVRVTYNGIGTQTNVNRRFTALMTGRIEGNVLGVSGRARPNGRDFSATIQCRKADSGMTPLQTTCDRQRVFLDVRGELTAF
jgi:hypothetical protein